MMRFNVQNKVATNETNSDLDTSMRSESERSHSSVSLASLSLFAKNLKKQAGGLKQKIVPLINRSKAGDFDKMEASFQSLSILLEASHEFSQEFQAELKDSQESVGNFNLSGATMQTCDESFSNISLDGEVDELESSLGSGGDWIVDTDGPGRGVNLVVPREGETLPHMQLCITRSSGRRVRFSMDQPRQDELWRPHHQPWSPASPPLKSILSASPNYSPRRANTFQTHVSPSGLSSPPLLEPSELDMSGRSTGSTDSLDLSRDKRYPTTTASGRLAAGYVTPRRRPRRGGRRPRRHLPTSPSVSPSQRLTIPNW